MRVRDFMSSPPTPNNSIGLLRGFGRSLFFLTHFGCAASILAPESKSAYPLTVFPSLIRVKGIDIWFSAWDVVTFDKRICGNSSVSSGCQGKNPLGFHIPLCRP